MSDEKRINYYVLFETYTQGMMLQELLRGEKIPSRISPTPRAIQGKLGCGMSLLIQPEDIDAVKECIERNQAEHYDIVPMECQIHPNRHKFC